MKKLFKTMLAIVLTVIMAVSFASCSTQDIISPEKVEAKLKELGYEIELIVDKDRLDQIEETENCGDLLAVLTASVSEERGSHVVASVIWFKNKEDASAFANQYQEYIDSIPEGYTEEVPEIVVKRNFGVMGFSGAFETICEIMGAM